MMGTKRIIVIQKDKPVASGDLHCAVECGRPRDIPPLSLIIGVEASVWQVLVVNAGICKTLESSVSVCVCAVSDHHDLNVWMILGEG